VTTYDTTDPGSNLGVAMEFFPGSGGADSKRSESSGGYSSATKILAVKLS